MSSRGAELSGFRIVVTRAPHQAGSLSSLLEERGAEVLNLPTIRIAEPEDWAPVDELLRNIRRYDAVLIGSKNAVEAVKRRGFTVPVPVVAVGRKTKVALSTCPETFTGELIVAEDAKAEGMVAAIEERFAPVGGRRFLFLRAPEGRDAAFRLLNERGAVLDSAPVYRIVRADPPDDTALHALQKAHIFTFMSGETLAAFLELVPGAQQMLKDAVVAVIGPVAADRARALGVRVDVVPKERSVEGLVAELVRRGSSTP